MIMNPEKIGINIRKARQERKLTQGNLADLLNVSESAVSQWESGKTSPDLGIIPEVCAVLDVSADYLLDISEEKRTKEIEKIIADAKLYSDSGRDDRAAKILGEGVKKYPSSDILVYNLLYCTYENNKVIELGEWLLKNSTDDAYRQGAIQCLVYAYSSINESQKAEKLARKMPQLNICSDALLCHALKGEEQYRHIQKYRSMLIDSLNSMLFRKMDGLTAAKKSIQFFEIMFEKSDYGFYNERMADNNVILAKNSAKQLEAKSTIDYLSEAVNHAKAFIDFCNDPNFKYSSVLFEGLPGEVVLHNESENTAKLLLGILEDTVFDFVRNDDSFVKIIARLSSIADEWPIKSK